MDEIRQTLENLRKARGDDYASLSRLLGRNIAYMQQFIQRGVPKRLAEADRRTLARYFGVEEVVLGGPEPEQADLVRIARVDVTASAGPGALVEDRAVGQLRLDPALVRSFGVRPDALSAIRVSGDSMLPTLADGDEILVNRDDDATRLREGVYVLRLDDGLVVKRIQLGAERQIVIRSDNPAWPDRIAGDDLVVIGRVLWVGRRLG